MEKNHLKGFLTFMFFAIIMAFSLSSHAQQKQITGNVTGSDGIGIPGVTVIVKASTVGTVTDIDGNYSLQLPADAERLVFSYIGMVSQELEIGNQTTINTSLEADVIGLQEVVAVGYATRKAGEVTGAVSTVQSSDIEEMAIVQASEALRAVPGVTVLKSNTPGEGASIRIRGLGTINDNNPLWIVDGVPGGSVTPNNIEQ